jgi:hypothetical protein
MGDGYSPSRIFLHRSPFWAELIEEQAFVTETWEFLPFALHGLIANSVTEIVLRPSSYPFSEDFDRHSSARAVDLLPNILKKRIGFMQEEEKSNARAYRVLRPFFDECGIEADEIPGCFVIKQKSSLVVDDEPIRSAIMLFEDVLKPFLNAMRCRSQVDIDIAKALRYIKVIENSTRSQEIMANMAVIKGVFKSYRQIEHHCLECKMSSSDNMIDLFNDIVKTPEYRFLSSKVSAFGYNINFDVIKSNIAAAVKSVVKSKIGKNIIGYGTKVTSAYAGVPLPDVEFAESLLRESFFPPIVDTSKIFEEAGRRLVANARYDVKYLGPGITC